MDTATETVGSETSESTATKSTESTGQGEVETQGSQGQTDNASGEQSSAESGKDNGTGPRRQFRSKNETIYELRQKDREWAQKHQQLEARIAEFEKKFQPRTETKPSRSFYQAPEDTLREILKETLEPFRENLLGEFRQTQEERETQVAMRQEATEAAKFLRSQKGMTEDDVQEMREILATDERVKRLADSPMEQAEYLLYIYNKQKGVDNKQPLKDKAFTPTGSSTVAGKPRQFSESELEAEFRKIADPSKPMTPEQKQRWAALESEVRQAYHDNRVKK